MALADFAAGANNAIQEILKKRLLEQRYQDAQKQQAFQNQLATRTADRADEQLKATTENNRLMREAQQRNTNNTRAQQIVDRAEPDTFYPENDPTAQMIRGTDYASFLKPVQPTQAMGPDFQGPMPDAETPQQAQVGRQGGFLKMATSTQRMQESQRLDRIADNNRLDAQAAQTHADRQDEIKRQRERDDQAHNDRVAALNMRPDPDLARVDRSYQQHVSRIDKQADPVTSQLDRVGRLQMSLDQNSPQADALLAPELLTTIAGGQGSGLRMTEAEIARIIGGRSNWEGIKAALNAWQTDPSKAFAIRPEQRAQMRALVNEMHGRLSRKSEAIERARDAIIDAKDVDTQRRVYESLRRELDAVDRGGAATTPSHGGTPPSEQRGTTKVTKSAEELIRQYGGR